MKKLINHPDDVLAESLAGFAAAHADLVVLAGDGKFVRRAQPTPGKVALVSGGGSGHEPLHAGFVGRGMLDAACPGQVFTSPTPDQMVAAAEAVDGGAGVLFIVKNYEGDVMNFQMAADMLADASGKVATVITDDDVAVEASIWSAGRRGVAGTLVVEKIVGAAAEQGMSLERLAELGKAVNAQTRSMGVALDSCTIPAAGKPNFSLADDEMEMGVGIHGEPGRRRVKLASADDIAAEMIAAILKDLAPSPGGAVPAAGQRFRRHARDGTVPDGPCRPAPAGRTRPAREPVSHRLLRHVPGDGRLLHHRHPARRRDAAILGRAGPHAGLAEFGQPLEAHALLRLPCAVPPSTVPGVSW